MKVFRYSKNEYRHSYKSKFLSPDAYMSKKIELHRTGIDDKTCRINIRGYPQRPRNLKNLDSASIKALSDQIVRDKAQILAVQIDPMPYLWNARKFAIEHISGKRGTYWQD